MPGVTVPALRMSSRDSIPSGYIDCARDTLYLQHPTFADADAAIMPSTSACFSNELKCALLHLAIDRPAWLAASMQPGGPMVPLLLFERLRRFTIVIEDAFDKCEEEDDVSFEELEAGLGMNDTWLDFQETYKGKIEFVDVAVNKEYEDYIIDTAGDDFLDEQRRRPDWVMPGLWVKGVVNVGEDGVEWEDVEDELEEEWASDGWEEEYNPHYHGH